MGYSVLYIAFAIVALWLLGEVLLQYKARLRWRALAFAGFLCVAGGVALGEVVVIVLGALAFGTGQTLVTLSYKRGFSTGWALGGRPGSSRRRRSTAPRVTEPVLEVTPVEEESAPAAAPGYGPFDGEQLQAGPAEAIYQPVPMHDESGEYPLYDNQPAYAQDPYTSGGYEGYGAQQYGDWGAQPQPAAASTPTEGGYGGGYDNSGYGGGYEQHQSPQEPGWDTTSHGYGYQQPPYQEQPAPAGTGYDGYGQGAGDWQSQSQQPYPQAQPQPAADPYGSYGYEQQPYIPHQQQAPYEQQQAQPQPQPQQGEPAAEYADPYDPYRY